MTTTFAAAMTVTSARVLRVASVPSNHVYVRHIGSESVPGVVRLPDPRPAGAERSAASEWWPPRMLEPAWAHEHDDFDVFHIHFGFDACEPAQLEELVRVLRRKGVPLVYTVHDLQNPHHDSTREHDAQLNVLIPGADALITLTSGAARQIARRWGREATVLPHPHVVPLDLAARLRRERRSASGEFRVGVHLKSVRAGMNPLPVIGVLADALAGLDGAVLQVNGHRDVLEPDGARYAPELADTLRRFDEEGRVDLRVHDYFTDGELWGYLSSLDVSVLPYRRGTHSGWLEACRDLGTTVLAPSCGHYRDQGAVLRYEHDASGFGAGSLRSAIRRAYEERPDLSVSLVERGEQRIMVANEHARIYSELMA